MLSLVRRRRLGVWVTVDSSCTSQLYIHVIYVLTLVHKWQLDRFPSNIRNQVLAKMSLPEAGSALVTSSDRPIKIRTFVRPYFYVLQFVRMYVPTALFYNCAIYAVYRSERRPPSTTVH